MKVFLNTNVFIEYIEKHRQFDAFRQIFNLLEYGKLEGVVSGGSLYYCIHYRTRVKKERDS